MNISAWKAAGNDDVSAGNRREGGEEEGGPTEASGGKTVISKPSSSSSSSWVRSSKDPRIVRVSRALGGKDRHSKVCTVRGLRDRRVRLSVPTAIQLYDLQERLGVDQPSKVVDWLLDAAKDDIHLLPPLPFSPHHFTHFLHHLNPTHHPQQLPGQLGPKNDVVQEEEEVHLRKNDVVLGSNIQQQQQQHVGSYYGLEHEHQEQQGHVAFQTSHNNLVPFPSQILVCPTTTQSLFPSPVEMTSQFHHHHHVPASSSSQHVSALYSLIHGGYSGGGHHSIRIPVQFNQANNANADADAGNNAGGGSDS